MRRRESSKPRCIHLFVSCSQAVQQGATLLSTRTTNQLQCTASAARGLPSAQCRTRVKGRPSRALLEHLSLGGGQSGEHHLCLTQEGGLYGALDLQASRGDHTQAVFGGRWLCPAMTTAADWQVVEPDRVYRSNHRLPPSAPNATPQRASAPGACLSDLPLVELAAPHQVARHLQPLNLPREACLRLGSVHQPLQAGRSHGK